MLICKTIPEGTVFLCKGSQKYKVQSLKSGLYKLINVTYNEANTEGIKASLQELIIFFNKEIKFPSYGVKKSKDCTIDSESVLKELLQKYNVYLQTKILTVECEEFINNLHKHKDYYEILDKFFNITNSQINKETTWDLKISQTQSTKSS